MQEFPGWRIDHGSKIPLYQQITKIIKADILEGKLKPGTKLSQRRVADIFNMGRMPVSEAFAMLEAEGLLISKPQSGTIVTDNIWLLLNSKKNSFWHTYTNSGHHKQSPEVLMKEFEKMDNEVSIKINGDRIASSFSPQAPLIGAMQNVSKRLSSTEDLGYYGRSGLPSLKNALSEHMKRYGIDAPAEQIIVTSGIGESLTMVSMGFLGAGSNFFYGTPSFINTIMLIQSTGSNMNEVAMDLEGIDVNELLPKLRRSKDSVLYIQPVNHNPTGTHVSKDRRNKIMAVCSELGVPIIENDMFRDFSFESPFPRPLKAFDKNGQVVYIGSLLSCFMGFKLSWVVAPTFIIKRLIDIKTHFELMSNVFVEMFAEEMLTSGEYYRYFDRIRPLMVSQYNLIEQMLDKYLSDIVTWRRGYPSYFIWLKFNDDINIMNKYEDHNEYLFFPGVIFDWSDKSHVRLNTLGTNTENIESWIKKISALARNCKK